MVTGLLGGKRRQAEQKPQGRTYRFNVYLRDESRSDHYENTDYVVEGSGSNEVKLIRRGNYEKGGGDSKSELDEIATTLTGHRSYGNLGKRIVLNPGDTIVLVSEPPQETPSLETRAANYVDRVGARIEFNDRGIGSVTTFSPLPPEQLDTLALLVYNYTVARPKGLKEIIR